LSIGVLCANIINLLQENKYNQINQRKNKEKGRG
jgi:hypothetical protein